MGVASLWWRDVGGSLVAPSHVGKNLPGREMLHLLLSQVVLLLLLLFVDLLALFVVTFNNAKVGSGWELVGAEVCCWFAPEGVDEGGVHARW